MIFSTRSRMLSTNAQSKIRRLSKDAYKSFPSWVMLARELDALVASRSITPKLLSQDSHLVEELCHELCREYADADAKQEFAFYRNAHTRDSGATACSDHEPAKCNLVAHFFVARLFEGSALQIRAHLLTGESEDTAHSHGASFFSHCISGGYTHEIWKKVLGLRGSSNEKPHFFETKRTRGSLPSAISLPDQTGERGKQSKNVDMFNESVKRAGKFILCEEETHEHRRGDIYFMDAADIFHKVCVRAEHLVAAPSVTLVVRGKQATFENSHFVTVGAPLSQTVIDGASVDLAEVQREKYLLLLRSAMQDYCKSGIGAPNDRGEGMAYRVFERSHS